MRKILLLGSLLVVFMFLVSCAPREEAVAGEAVKSVAVCGDSLKHVREQCDDGNKVSGDGCSSVCKIESGWDCTMPTTKKLAGGKISYIPSKCTQVVAPAVCDDANPNFCLNQQACIGANNKWYIDTCYDACPAGTEDPELNSVCTELVQPKAQVETSKVDLVVDSLTANYVNTTSVNFTVVIKNIGVGAAVESTAKVLAFVGSTGGLTSLITDIYPSVPTLQPGESYTLTEVYTPYSSCPSTHILDVTLDYWSKVAESDEYNSKQIGVTC